MFVECLENIRAQTHQDYEIIVKDAFPGESVKLHKDVAETMRSFGSKLNYIAIADKNLTEGLNLALWWATGDILHYICGDDLIGDKETLEYVHRSFYHCNPSRPAWIMGSTFGLKEDGSEASWGITPFATLEETLIHNRMGCGATYWNRAMFKRIGYWNTKYAYAADYDYWCRCYRICPPMYTTRCLGAVRGWNECTSRINAEKLELEAQEIADKNRAEHKRGEAPIYLDFKQ